jgi:hypothetical protein
MNLSGHARAEVTPLIQIVTSEAHMVSRNLSFDRRQILGWVSGVLGVLSGVTVRQRDPITVVDVLHTTGRSPVDGGLMIGVASCATDLTDRFLRVLGAHVVVRVLVHIGAVHDVAWLSEVV